MLPRHFAQPKQHIAIIVTYNCNNVIMPLYPNLEKPFFANQRNFFQLYGCDPKSQFYAIYCNKTEILD